MTEGDEVDLVVVGAGLSGIAAARFYLEVNPNSRVTILERDQCVGGVWSSKRSHGGFWTQWTVGYGEWSDAAMPRPPDSDVYYEFFKAKHTTDYLENYIDTHIYNGRTLRDRVRFEFQVQAIRRDDTRWSVMGSNDTIRTSKIIIASGLTSVPNMPRLPGRAAFGAPIIHSQDFGFSSVLSAPDFTNVVVVGGGKSSADMVYSCVKAGKSVSWIVRPSGTGPGFMFPVTGKGPYKNAFELGSARFTGILSPSFYSQDNMVAKLLHQTRLGRYLVRTAGDGADADMQRLAGFDTRQGALEGFKNLKPHTSFFWQNCTGGLLNHPDYWDVIAQHVRIYADEISDLKMKTIHLKGGQEVAADVLLCGTGFDKAAFTFFEKSDLVRLGLPYPRSDQPDADADLWEHLQDQADEEVLGTFPMLREPPEHTHKPMQYTPFRLYNGIAPLHDDSIAFVGFIECANYFRGVECQAIWATAFLDQKIRTPSLDIQQADVARHLAWCRRRYLSNGESGTYISFETNLYLEKLLREVGLSSHLKGWFTNWFVPSRACDLAGLKDEYMRKYHLERSDKHPSQDQSKAVA